MALAGKPVFRYLDARTFGLGPLGARGNVLRLFMRVHNVAFDEELVSVADWQAGEKARTISEGINPAGYLPSVQIGGKYYTETISTARYLARKLDLYGVDAEVDWLNDAVADAHQSWRNEVVGTFGQAEDSDAVVAYRAKRSFWYGVFEAYCKRLPSGGSPFFSGGEKPGFADIALFNLMRDDQMVHGPMPPDVPRLAKLHGAVASQPEVAKWVEEWEASCK